MLTERRLCCVPGAALLFPLLLLLLSSIFLPMALQGQTEGHQKQGSLPGGQTRGWYPDYTVQLNGDTRSMAGIYLL